MSEDPQPDATPSAPPIPDVGQEVEPAKVTRLTDIVTAHLTDQARLTAEGAKARRVRTSDGQPGMADLTPLRELYEDLVEEIRKVRPRERIARSLRQAADVLDPPGQGEPDQG